MENYELGESFMIISDDSVKNLDELDISEYNMLKKQDYVATCNKTKKIVKKGVSIYNIAYSTFSIGKYVVAFV